MVSRMTQNSAIWWHTEGSSIDKRITEQGAEYDHIPRVGEEVVISGKTNIVQRVRHFPNSKTVHVYYASAQKDGRWEL